MAGKSRSKAPERPVGQPGDAAAKAFQRLRWDHRRMPQRPDGKAVFWAGLIVVLGIGLTALYMNYGRPPDDIIFNAISEEEARALPEPEDLGPAPDLAPLVNWAFVPEEIGYAEHITAMWFRRQPSCIGCGRADGYMESLDRRHADDGLQVVDVLHISEARFERERETFERLVLLDPDRDIARAFVGSDDVPPHYVVIVDDRGHIRYAAATWPDYGHMETILAKLLVDL